MALASQTSGPVRRNRYMYRRRRTHPSRWIGFIAFLVIAGLVVWFFIPSSSDETADVEPTSQMAQVQPPKVNVSRPIKEPTPVVTPTLPVETPTRVSEPAPAEPQVEQTPPTTVASASTDVNTTPIEVEDEPIIVPSPPSLAVTTRSTVDTPSAEVADAIKLAQTDPIEARAQLSALLATGQLSPADRTRVRTELTDLGNTLFFTKRLFPNDPFARQYVIQNGDSLERIAKREDMTADWKMIQRLNQITNPHRIRIGDRLKLPVGTFHAVVYKSEFILELYLEQNNERVLIATYPVGLGEFDATPLGRFVVKRNSRLENPQWTNPRTGEFFASDDPKNPIGERWLGLRGVDPENSEMLGYGIHGTIDPSSIGQMKSMGCIRLRDDDVRVVYEALSERGSNILIRP